MADLSFDDKRKLERILDMGGGYVLDFSNRTLTEFVFDHTGLNIGDPKYDRGSGSKAQRLRAFWEKEPNHVVGSLLSALLSYLPISSETTLGSEATKLRADCERIVARLREGGEVLDVGTLTIEDDGRDFELVAKSVRDAIERNELEAGLDRLHTFTVKFIRAVSAPYGIEASREKPLHSIFGEYVRLLRARGAIESVMTERILKTSISVLEAFNDVRNEQSLAHDNPVLNYDEALLIFNDVVSLIRFVRAVNEKQVERGDSG